MPMPNRNLTWLFLDPMEGYISALLSEMIIFGYTAPGKGTELL